MKTPTMLGMPTYVKTMLMLSAVLPPIVSFAANDTAFDRMGGKAVGSEWDSIKNAKSGDAAQDLENGITRAIDLMWLFGILIGAGFVLFGVIKFITATKNQQSIAPGVAYFVGGLFLMVLGVLSWVFAAQIKNMFI